MKGIQVCFFLFGFFLLGCQKPGDLEHIPYQPEKVDMVIPSRFVKVILPSDNPMTFEGVALGKKLFFDPILSKDSTLSCAGCHLPGFGFSDGKKLAEGINGNLGKRNAMSLANVGFYHKGLFWDGRASSLEEQALIPVEDPNELGSNWETIEKKLQEHDSYPKLFRKAFGIIDKSEVDRYLVAKALSQFERTLVSFNTKYDQVERGEASYTDSEQRGFDIFFDTSKELPDGQCGHCHTDPLFTDLTFQNNGLEPVDELNSLEDNGRAAVTGRTSDRGKFRVPTLRNVALTAPYMHDGRFDTLEEVIDHYNSGGHFSGNLNPNVRQLNLSGQDKKDLIAFLHTLTDTIVTNSAIPETLN